MQQRAVEPSDLGHSSPVELDGFWARPAKQLLDALATSPAGLSAEEVALRRARYGPNLLARPRRGGSLALLVRQFTDPIVLLLVFAAVLAIVLGDLADASIILAIVGLSGLLGFWQERRAGLAVQRLLGLVQVQVQVRRDGAVVKVPPADVVPGDVVVLHAGDIVPCDCRVLQAVALQVDDAALTGETFPRHKHPAPAAADAPLAERHCALLLGSHVVSGRGEALAVGTGSRTELGRLSRRLEATAPKTGFEQGITRFGLLLARVTAVLTATILVVNLVLGRPLADSVLFSLALAVGLTPQLLPAIVAVSLATGARRMARQRVIVRRLDAIEDFGAMNLLCTDKTGTLTEGTVRLHAALDIAGQASPLVAAVAARNAALQTGFANPIDAAILDRHPTDSGWRAVDEVPFDFTRKRLSVLADGPDGRQLLTKGAFSAVVGCCASALAAEGVVAFDSVRDELERRYRELSEAGFRVLAVARRDLPAADHVSAADERQLTFLGFLAFLDPPKPGVDRTIGELAAAGIGLRMISGDNRLAAAHVAASVGIDPSGLLTGAEIDRLDDHQLTLAARDTHVFAEVDPVHKERIIQALRTGGTVVGYLGDGINDAGALHLADVGISVDTAVDVAKSAAAIVLLDKDLGVLAEGVRLGGQAPVLPGRRPARPPSTKRAPPPAAGPRRRRAQRPLAATMKLQGERVVPWRPIANPSSRPGGLPDRRDGQRFGGACGRGRSALPARAGGTHAQGGGWVRDERGRPMASASRGGMATAKEFGMLGSAIAFDQVGSVGPILAEAASSR